MIRRFLQWIRARWRGEVRVAPRYARRGRLYGRKGESPAGMEAKGEPKASISARVYRAATDTWEDHGVIAGSRVNEGNPRSPEE